MPSVAFLTYHQQTITITTSTAHHHHGFHTQCVNKIPLCHPEAVRSQTCEWPLVYFFLGFQAFQNQVPSIDRPLT